eukprot:1190914-Prorocentrum_minimum.AAC.7
MWRVDSARYGFCFPPPGVPRAHVGGGGRGGEGAAAEPAAPGGGGHLRAAPVFGGHEGGLQLQAGHHARSKRLQSSGSKRLQSPGSNRTECGLQAATKARLHSRTACSLKAATKRTIGPCPAAEGALDSCPVGAAECRRARSVGDTNGCKR